MSKYVVNNEKIGKYNINLELDKRMYAIVSNYKWITRDLLLTLSGVLKSENCTYNDNLIFDNKDYFKKRILIDFDKEHINTLESLKIKKNLLENYKLKFDDKKFKALVKETNLRNEVVINDKYFTDYGKYLSNACLALSLNTLNMFIMNFDIDDDAHKLGIDSIKKKVLTDLKNNDDLDNIIIECSSVDLINKYFDKVIILTDYDDAYVIDHKRDDFVFTYDNIKLKNKLFNCGEFVYTKNSYTKDELKELKKNQKCEIHSFKEMLEVVSRYNRGK